MKKATASIRNITKAFNLSELVDTHSPLEAMGEHIVIAHPVRVMLLCALFRALFSNGFVPDGFGISTVIPLLKDKTGGVNSLDDYRGITLLLVIAKLIELVILEIRSERPHVCRYYFTQGFSRRVT
jgi:hypothetical protein